MSIQRRFNRQWAERSAAPKTPATKGPARRRKRRAERIVETHARKMALKVAARKERPVSIPSYAVWAMCQHMREIRAREKNFLGETHR